MKINFNIMVGFISLFVVSACSKTTDCESTGKDCSCYAVYSPVCGCDGLTYENSCRANCVDIEIVSQGVCPE